jgi:serine/threonine-protein kinase
MILGDRYRIVRELGHGGFGRTYLAEDINRFNEACVLKEFAPQVQGTYALQKSQELFEREAGVLYKLQHPQIPRFREMFRANFASEGHLFLVQDYVDGQTYRQLLETRRQQGRLFNEADVTQLLLQLLPVLQYLHQAGVIHRDISPDNLILRYSDQLPVLIDFGGVKHIAAEAASHYISYGAVAAAPATRLGKVGYAPVEQMEAGQVSPQSDLYSLAATVLVLLTGQEPHHLLENRPVGHWRSLISVTPAFATLLERMLAPRPGDRYQSSTDVLYALQTQLGYATQSSVPPPGPSSSADIPSPPPPLQTVSATVPLVPAQKPRSAPVKTQPAGWGMGWWILLFVLIGALGGAGWLSRHLWLPLLTDHSSVSETSPTPDTARFSPEEQARKETLRDRLQALKVDSAFLIQLTDATFGRRYPDQKGRTLTTGPEDAPWRARWDAIALEWLDQLEQNLSPTARRQLGRYDQRDRAAQKQAVNQLHVSSRALNDLTDAKFFYLFPDQRQQAFLNQPIGQIWQAIAADTVRSLQNGTALKNIEFSAGRYSEQLRGTLAPGAGMVYIANLKKGQFLRLNLQAPAQSTLLSIYVPRPTQQTPFYLEDSSEVVWSGEVSQRGYYEIVVVSRQSDAIAYTLDIAVDNVTSSPSEPVKPEATKRDR